jgi:preprotein translocase SecE subunit
MAVAVKNAPETASWSPFHRLPIASLAAAIYLVVCLGLVFKLIPTLWWANTAALTNEFVSAAILILVMVVVGVVLVVVGKKLFGGRELPGLRAGIFMALVFVLFAAMIARWFGGMLENWIYNGRWFGDAGPFVGSVIAGVVAAFLLFLVIRMFHRPGFERWLVRLEAQGWFSATSFKRGQGLRVRRGTTFAILVVGLCGIWVLENHRTLDKGSPDWGFSVPFTGKIYITEPGDAKTLLVEDKEVIQQSRVEVRKPGSSNFKEGQFVERDEFDAAGGILKGFEDRAKKPETSGDAASRPEPPEGVLVVDRFLLRDINQRLKEEYVKVSEAKLPATLSPQPGEVLSRRAFGEAVDRIKSEGYDKDKYPEVKTPAPLEVAPTYASITVLPAAKLTVPLLLFALTLWLGWRIVNMPVFADFLIATEAELNKVSWTTRKRLVQDTVVVLITLVLMVIFLFAVDVAWGRILSWRPIGVLQVSDQKQESTSDAELKW